ncbi:hypothetical protein HZ326_28667 [Fusarium oxysporum f. sp. albedinis]|nr:hypothetical protein HZ326_28667 [Fusarium oxysporum f. sp. albedinis]
MEDQDDGMLREQKCFRNKIDEDEVRGLLVSRFIKPPNFPYLSRTTAEITTHNPNLCTPRRRGTSRNVREKPSYLNTRYSY